MTIREILGEYPALKDTAGDDGVYYEAEDGECDRTELAFGSTNSYLAANILRGASAQPAPGTGAYSHLGYTPLTVMDAQWSRNRAIADMPVAAQTGRMAATSTTDRVAGLTSDYLQSPTYTTTDATVARRQAILSAEELYARIMALKNASSGYVNKPEPDKKETEDLVKALSSSTSEQQAVLLDYLQKKDPDLKGRVEAGLKAVQIKASEELAEGLGRKLTLQ